MARKKASYELWFSVNDSEVASQLHTIDKSLSNTNSEYRLLKKNLEGAWNTTNWVRAQQISQKAVEDTSAKVKILKDRLAEMEKEGVTDKNKEAFEKLKREIVAAENEAQKAKKRLEEINNLKMENIKKQLKSVSDKLTSIGKTLTIGVTAPIVAAGVASIKMSTNMEEAINKVEVAFGDAASRVLEFSNTTLTTYGIAKSTGLDMAALFGDMATSMGFSQDAAAELSTELVALAGDLASFKNISLEQAQTALSGIFTGETESLKKLGVVMTVANLNAHALTQGIKKTVDEMSESEKVALRMSYILEKTKNSQGDFARTTGNTANQLRMFSESLKELAAIGGQELMPIVTPIIKQLNELIQKLGRLDDGTKDIITKTAIFAASFGPLLTVTGKLTGSVGTLITAYQTLKTALAAKKTADAAATTSQVALNTAMSANPAGAVAAAISVLVAALGSFAIMSALTSQEAETLAEKVKKIGESYENAVEIIDEKASKDAAELDLIEKLIPRYDELNKKTNKTAEEKAELKYIVDEINRVMPDTIKLLNEEKGLYDALSTSIYGTVEARRAEIQAIADREAALEAQKSLNDLIKANNGETAESARKKLEQLKSELEKAKDNDYYRYMDRPTATGKNIEELKKEIKALESFIKEYERLQKDIDKYVDAGKEGGSTETGKWLSGVGGGTDTAADEALKKFKAAKEKLDHQLAMDEISEKKYYSKLESLSKKYLSGYADQESERNRVTEAAYKFRKSVKEKEVEEEKKRLDEQKKALEKQLKNAEDFTNKVVSLAEKEANAKIAAIDAEMAARDKLKAQQEKELQLQQAMARLAFTRDKDSRESLQREINRLKSEIKENEIRAQAESEKAAIQAEIERLKESASTAVSKMQASLTPESINPLIKQFAPNLTVNASGLTVSQAEQLIHQAIQKILYNL